MKRLLISAIAAVSLTAAVTPALAQSYRGDDSRYGERYDRGYGERYDRGDGNLNAREAQLRRRIDDAEQRGLMSRWDARRLRQEMNSLEQLEQRYRNNGEGYRYGRAGLTPRERADMENRLNIFSEKIDRATHDRWDRRR